MPVHTIDWYRTPLDPEVLKELNERSDTLGWLQSGGYLLTVMATGASVFLAYFYLSWPWVIAALFLHGTCSAFMINAVHELVHGTVFKTKWLNELFALIFGFLGWHSPYMFWCSHTEHHKYTLHPPDDQEVVLPITPYQSVWQFIKTSFINPRAMQYFVPSHWRLARGKFHKGWETTIIDLASPRERKLVIWWSRFVLLGHGTIIFGSVAAAVLTRQWWILLIPVVVSFIPCYGGWLQGLLNNTQHVGLVDSVPDFRLCCRTIETNFIFRFLYWHMNYHTEHHMYAGVPCYKLRKLHKLIKHELPPTKGLLGAWAEIAFILAQQKVDPKYQYVQPIPGVNVVGNTLPVAKSVPGAAAGGESSKPTRNSRGGRLRKWECSVCGFIYDEALGLPEEGIAPGTAWEDIPDDWSCPDCGVAKSDFHMVEITAAEAAAEAAAASAAEATSECDAVDAARAPKTPLVIIGSGLAGYSLAKEVRGLGVDRPITLLTRDGGEFYSKPMLSNALHEGLTPEALVKSTAQDMAHRFKIDVRTHVHVQKIDRQRKVVVTDAGEFPYGHLVLAVGADQISLPITGEAVSRIHQVNDLASYAAFRKALPEGGRVLIIGGGLIGCEFANDLAGRGFGVDVVDIAPAPLSRLVPAQVGEALRDALAGAGVKWHLGTSVQSVSNAGDRIACHLANGEVIEADVVLSAVGLRPRINLAQQAGLAVNRGIVVDSHLRTSDPDIFAVGDCAEVQGKVMPYVHPIFEAIRSLAHTLSGDERAVAYPVMPVVVKTPACPLVTCPPEPDAQGQWKVEGSGINLKALFVEPSGERVLGFVLAGSEVAHKNEIAKQVHLPASQPSASPAAATAV
jgi:rubredoxin-NAD+ reductase